MDEIILIGGGGHCRSVIDVIEAAGKFQIVGIIDRPELLGTKVLSYDIVGNDDDLHQLYQECKYAFITVGQIKSADLRVKLFKVVKEAGLTMPTIISPRAYVSKYAFIDEGTVIMHDALINANAKVGRNCIVNTKALVEHDSEIEGYCHVSTGAIINGSVHVKRNSFIGSNAITRESVMIEENSFVKAGSVVK